MAQTRHDRRRRHPARAQRSGGNSPVGTSLVRYHSAHLPGANRPA